MASIGRYHAVHHRTVSLRSDTNYYNACILLLLEHGLLVFLKDRFDTSRQYAGALGLIVRQRSS